MAVDQAVLWKFLMPLVSDKKLVSESLSRMKSLFETANRGKYDLSRQSYFSETDAAKAIAEAIGRPVKRVVSISVAKKTLGPPELAQDEVFLVNQGLNIGDSLWQALWDRHNYRVTTGLKTKFGSDFKDKLSAALKQSLCDDLSNAMLAALQGKRWSRHGACLWNNAWQAIVYFVASAALGERRRCDELADLVRLLASGLPLCNKNSDPQVWIVLVA